MSIYIESMEMPTRCAECRLSTVNNFNDKPLCDVLVEYMSYKEWEVKRLDNCPLVPIPPHGDLIDRDPFIEFIKTHWDRYDQWFVEQLEARPTIIPAEDGK